MVASTRSSPLQAPDRRLSAGGLRDLLAVVNSSRGLDEILAYLVVQADEVLGSDGVGLYLTDEADPDALVLQAAHDVSTDLLNLLTPISLPIVCLSVSEQRSVVVSDFPASPSANHSYRRETSNASSRRLPNAPAWRYTMLARSSRPAGGHG